MTADKVGRWCVTGASGLLGTQMVKTLLASGKRVFAVTNSHDLNIAANEALTQCGANLMDRQGLSDLIRETRPAVLVNCVGMTNVDQCEKDRDLADLLNHRIVGWMGCEMAAIGGGFVQISTDHLWNGENSYIRETEPVDPINVYAETKALGEVAAREANPEALVLRTNFFGPSLPWRQSFNDWVVGKLKSGEGITAFSDVHFTPIASPLLCETLIELVDRGAEGIYNVAGSSRISKLEFARMVAAWHRLDTALIKPGTVADAHLQAPRPKDMSMSVEKIETFLGRAMPNIDASIDALKEFETS